MLRRAEAETRRPEPEQSAHPRAPILLRLLPGQTKQMRVTVGWRRLNPLVPKITLVTIGPRNGPNRDVCGHITLAERRHENLVQPVSLMRLGESMNQSLPLLR